MPASSGAQPAAHPSAKSAALSKASEGRCVRSEAAGQRASHPAQPHSRLLKGAHPLQSRPRRPASDARWSLARCLTGRDRAIVAALDRHRVFTTDQLGEMFFESQHRARVRLVALHRLGVLDRFQLHRPGWGATAFHYVLGPMGAAIVAAETGGDPDRAARRWRPERTLALGRTQRLAHLLGVNGFYASLVGHSRVTPSTELADWLTEAECAHWSDGIVRPDAFGHWRQDNEGAEFSLEWDRGTETLGRLVAKLAGYERFESERGATASGAVRLRLRPPRSSRAAGAGRGHGPGGHRRARQCSAARGRVAAPRGRRGGAGAVVGAGPGARTTRGPSPRRPGQRPGLAVRAVPAERRRAGRWRGLRSPPGTVPTRRQHLSQCPDGADGGRRLPSRVPWPPWRGCWSSWPRTCTPTA